MKRIIIVGATSGIGKEMALRYAAAGNLVGITGRRGALLNQMHTAFPGQFFPACFDVRQDQNQEQFLNLIEAMGGLDLLIYNAGFGQPSAAYDAEAEIASTETNVNGCVELVSAAFDYFLRQGQGQIAITSSVAGLRGNSRAPAYSAGKAFQRIFAEGLNSKAKNLGQKIVVTDIRPGFLNTKPAGNDLRFWAASPEKAALQIIKAIEQKKRVAYITKRWWLVAQLMKLLPFALYRRLV